MRDKIKKLIEELRAAIDEAKALQEEKCEANPRTVASGRYELIPAYSIATGFISASEQVIAKLEDILLTEEVKP